MRYCILALLWITSQFAWACDCPPLKKLEVAQLEPYHVVFKGTVDSIGQSFAYFMVKEAYKGKLTQQVKVVFDDTSSCRITFAKKEEWLIYAYYTSYGNLQVDFCSPSRKHFADSTKDYYQVTSQLGYEAELDFLKNNLGIQSLQLPKKDTTAMPKPELIQPSSDNKLWLIIGSLLFFIILILLLKKFF